MLGFEHPSHMVTHPSTDEAQCCLSLEIFVNSAKKKERKKMKIGSRVPSELRGLINYQKLRYEDQQKISLYKKERKKEIIFKVIGKKELGHPKNELRSLEEK